MSDSESPLVTAHAADRWDTRTPDDSVAPETAWAHGQRIRAGAPFQSIDEIRHHNPTGTLLLRTASTIETVYRVDELQRPHYEAVKHGLSERGRA